MGEALASPAALAQYFTNRKKFLSWWRRPRQQWRPSAHCHQVELQKYRGSAFRPDHRWRKCLQVMADWPAIVLERLNLMVVLRCGTFKPMPKSGTSWDPPAAGNFEQVRLYPLWHFCVFWAPLWTSAVFTPYDILPFLGPNPLFFGFQAFSGQEPAQILPLMTFWPFFGPNFWTSAVLPHMTFWLFLAPSPLRPYWPSTMSRTIPRTPWNLHKTQNLKPKTLNLKP